MTTRPRSPFPIYVRYTWIHVYVPSRVSRNSFFPPLERFYVCGTCISVPTLYHRNAEIDARGGRLLSYSWPDEYLVKTKVSEGRLTWWLYLVRILEKESRSSTTSYEMHVKACLSTWIVPTFDSRGKEREQEGKKSRSTLYSARWTHGASGQLRNVWPLTQEVLSVLLSLDRVPLPLSPPRHSSTYPALYLRFKAPWPLLNSGPEREREDLQGNDGPSRGIRRFFGEQIGINWNFFLKFKGTKGKSKIMDIKVEKYDDVFLIVLS